MKRSLSSHSAIFIFAALVWTAAPFAAVHAQYEQPEENSDVERPSTRQEELERGDRRQDELEGEDRRREQLEEPSQRQQELERGTQRQQNLEY